MLDSFLALLRGERPGEIVWTADITYWMAGRRAAGAAPAAWETTEGYLALHHELGLFPYYDYRRFWAGEARYDDSVAWERRTDGHRTLTRVRTPAGELTAESVYLPESCCTGEVKHFVETERDLAVLLDLLSRRHLVPIHLADDPAYRARWAAMGGYPSLALPRSPLAAFIYEWAGMLNAAYLLLDCAEQVRAALRLLEAQEEPVLDAVCALAPPVVHFPDNLSSENVTSYYDDLMAPGHRRRLARLHAAGVKAAVHLDGTVRGLLPKLAAAGFDAVEALTPHPAGDVTPEEMRALVDGYPTILWGGVPGAMFAPPYTWEEMQRHLFRLRDAWDGHPYIVGVADQVPPDGDIGFCRRIGAVLRG